VRTGSTAGSTGPTVILVKSEKKRLILTDKFLEKHGLATGSTIIMTPNAYMTDKAWVLISKAIAESIQPNRLNAVDAYTSVTLSIIVQTAQLLL
jgi:hypothetical protein